MLLNVIKSQSAVTLSLLKYIIMYLDCVDHILCKCKLFLSCSGLSGGFNFVLVLFFEYYIALFFCIICML